MTTASPDSRGLSPAQSPARSPARPSRTMRVTRRPRPDPGSDAHLVLGIRCKRSPWEQDKTPEASTERERLLRPPCSQSMIPLSCHCLHFRAHHVVLSHLAAERTGETVTTTSAGLQQVNVTQFHKNLCIDGLMFFIISDMNDPLAEL